MKKLSSVSQRVRTKTRTVCCASAQITARSEGSVCKCWMQKFN